MPLRWSYESAIISQAKLNPLTSTQENIEARIQEIVAKLRGLEDLQKGLKERLQLRQPERMTRPRLPKSEHRRGFACCRRGIHKGCAPYQNTPGKY